MRNPGRFAIRFALLALLGACSNSSTAPGSFPPIGSLGAIAVTPQNGSIEVEPDATVRITFATLLVAIPHDAIRFEDGGTRLAGNYFADEQSNAIKWRPEHEFRRGATIEVRVATDTGYQTITAFVVREANSILTTSIPGTFGSRTMAFAGGRRLVITGGATFEVVGATVTQLPVVIPPAAFAYGDQHIGFTAPETALLPTEYVRRDLSGNEQRISLPVAQPIGAHNERGDVAMFVTNDRGTPNDWGAWRLLANEFSWQWLGSLALPHQPHLGIAICCVVGTSI